MEQKFKKAADFMKSHKDLPLNNDQLLEIYALFKQATVGDCNKAKPGMFDMKGKAKWNAWNDKKGMSKEEAQKKYVELAKKYLPEDEASQL